MSMTMLCFFAGAKVATTRVTLWLSETRNDGASWRTTDYCVQCTGSVAQVTTYL